jgi:hypothetical protein
MNFAVKVVYNDCGHKMSPLWFVMEEIKAVITYSSLVL